MVYFSDSFDIFIKLDYIAEDLHGHYMLDPVYISTELSLEAPENITISPRGPWEELLETEILGIFPNIKAEFDFNISNCCP